MNGRQLRFAAIVILGLAVTVRGGASPSVQVSGSSTTAGAAGGAGVPALGAVSGGGVVGGKGFALGAVSGGGVVGLPASSKVFFGPPPIYVHVTPFGYYPFASRAMMPGPAGMLPPPVPMPFDAVAPAAMGPAVEPPRRPVRRVRRSNPDRAEQLVSLGDGAFRGGRLHRAQERYEQAMQADPSAATPHIRLAQVALVRGRYRDVAHHIRDALTADPHYLIHAPDIQALYGEPRDFHEQIARLESHLQAHPDDRDAWLVLGAQWFLSGRTRRAADVFLRLSDRHPDHALAAFLEASNLAARDR